MANSGNPTTVTEIRTPCTRIPDYTLVYKNNTTVSPALSSGVLLISGSTTTSSVAYLHGVSIGGGWLSGQMTYRVATSMTISSVVIISNVVYSETVSSQQDKYTSFIPNPPLVLLPGEKVIATVRCDASRYIKNTDWYVNTVIGK